MSHYIHSWDLFDTLIGRKCGTPDMLWMKMGAITGIPHFIEKRKAAERWFQERGDAYGLYDIYNQFDLLYGPTFGLRLHELEWKLELENVYPIKRNVRLLAPGDIIVSDMYLKEEELRILMKRAGIWFEGPIFVTNYGKHTGEIWKQLRDYPIRAHTGDNRWTDLENPRRYGITTRHARTGFSPYEEAYLPFSFALAYWVKRWRLELLIGEREEPINYLQISLNAPLLRLASQVLRENARQQRWKKLLFMSRDGHMFKSMFDKLYTDIATEYLYISRECLRYGTESYFRYLNKRLKADSALVDMASSATSLSLAITKLEVKQPNLWTLVFLPQFKADLSHINLVRVTTNQETMINNTWLEMLNYAPHWHIYDVDDAEMPHFDQVNEFDMRVVLIYNEIFQRMLEDAPIAEILDPEQLIGFILPEIHKQGSLLRQHFPGHLQFEAQRKRRFKKES